MKILVNCLFRDRWAVHCMAEDCKTVLSPFTPIESLAVLRRLLRCAGANDAEMIDFEKQIKTWSHGSCWISELTPEGAQLLRINTAMMLQLAKTRNTVWS
jgi:hypothetical protein